MLLTSFLEFKTDLMRLWSSDIALFQWIVLTFGSDSGEILLISSKLITFTTS